MPQTLGSGTGEMGLYGGLPPEMGGVGGHGLSQTAAASSSSSLFFSSSLASKLGLPLMPNPAPDVDLTPTIEVPPPAVPSLMTGTGYGASGSDVEAGGSSDLGPKKKKYAKEAWPGKKPAPSLLVWSDAKHFGSISSSFTSPPSHALIARLLSSFWPTFAP